jgi:hypothetical protein
LEWNKTINNVSSQDLLQFLGEADCHIDYKNNTVEWQHPMELSARANTEDNSIWEEAMCGPNKAGYWKAMETELHILEDDMDSWEEVDRENWMNV